MYASATDVADAPSASSTPQKENALPDFRMPSPLQGLSKPDSSQPLQQPPGLPAADHPQEQAPLHPTPQAHHRLSRMPAACSSPTACQLGSNSPDAKQQAFWVDPSPAVVDDTNTAQTGSVKGQGGVTEAVAVDAVSEQLEGLQLTPLTQLLKLCGQQVRQSSAVMLQLFGQCC